jgi:Amt family ammonium transporter
MMIHHRTMWSVAGLILLLLVSICLPAYSQDPPSEPAPAAAVAEAGKTEKPADEAEKPADDPTAKLTIGLDTIWVLLTAFLVFWMNTGFGCVESGFCRAKNATNILAKNFVVFALSAIAYWLVGWGLMFGDGNGFMGLKGLFMVSGADNSPAMNDAYEGVYGAIKWTGVPLMAKFFFQLVFAGTAATIVSGCVAERIHYHSFMIFTIFITIVFYPITGHWIWGGGWLQNSGFWDFAGSTVVHSVGGWAGLAGIIVLGPRIGKFRADGKVQPIPGHSMALAFLGAFVLWLGWFGFNPGSTMAVGDGVAIAHVVMTTNTACVFAILSATVLAWVWLGKPDFSMTLNGSLAGLVAITAPCAFVSIKSAAIIGIIAGLLVVPAVVFFDKIKVDDPVGALSVHLVNGIWGTIAMGLFAVKSAPGYVDGGPLGLLTEGSSATLIAQLKGVVAVGVYTFFGSLIVWYLIKAVFGLRVTPEDEARGLDKSEMGMEAYSGDPIHGGLV